MCKCFPNFPSYLLLVLRFIEIIGICKGFRKLIVIPCMKIVVTQNLSKNKKSCKKSTSLVLDIKEDAGTLQMHEICK